MSIDSPMMKHRDGDGFNIVRFKWETERNNAQSEIHGRPIFDKVLKIYIESPGAKNQRIVHEVERQFWVPEGEAPRTRSNEVLKHKYREQLAAWERNDAESMAGTPLEELKVLDVGAIASLKEMGVHTVEALSSVTDDHLKMGMRSWRKAAQAYMDQAKGQEPISKLIAESEEKDRRIADLEAAVSELRAAGEKRGPGRPRKDEA